MTTTEVHEHLGIKFEVCPRTTFPGVGWRIPRYDHLGRPIGCLESSGEFYDVEDHPEGAYAWAEAACKRFIERMLRNSGLARNSRHVSQIPVSGRHLSDLQSSLWQVAVEEGRAQDVRGGVFNPGGF